VALIGAGNQNIVILESCQKVPNVRITALCDIWTEYRQKHVSGRLRTYGQAHNTGDHIVNPRDGAPVRSRQASWVLNGELLHFPATERAGSG